MPRSAGQKLGRDIIICSWIWYCTAKSQPLCRPSSLWFRGSQSSHDTLENPKNTEEPRTLHLLNPPRYHHDPSAMAEEGVYLVEEEYLVTAFVPSDTACLASSPGRMSRTLRKALEVEARSDLWSSLRGLDLTGRNGGLLIVCSELGCLGGDALKDVWNPIRCVGIGSGFRSAYR